ATRVRQIWKDFDSTHRTETIKPDKESVRSVPAATAAPAPENWTDISVKDPFSFDRNDIAIVAPKQNAPVQPKPVLFGTMLVGKEWIAMLAPGQGATTRASRPVKIGESIGEWQVVEISEKSVVVAGENGSRQNVGLMESTAVVPRDSGRTLSTASSPQVNVAA